MSTTDNLVGHSRTVYLAIANAAAADGLTTFEVATLTDIDPKTVAGSFTHLRRLGKIAACVRRRSEGGSRMRVWAYNLPERITDPPENAPGMDAPARGRWRQIVPPAAVQTGVQNGAHGPQELAPAQVATAEPAEPSAPLPASSEAILAAGSTIPWQRLHPAATPVRPTREHFILTLILNQPGRTATELREFGLIATDAKRLQELEDSGLIVYCMGWRITGKGDARLLHDS